MLFLFKTVMPSRDGNSAHLLVFALALGWGFNWIASRVILEWLPPWTMRALGIGLGATTLLLAAFAGRIRLTLTKQQIAHVIAAAILNVIIFNVCSAYAQVFGTTSRAVVIAYSMPIWAAVLARVVLKEQLDRLRLFALTLCLAGLLILILPQARVGFPLGALFALGCAWAWAGGTIYLKWAAISAPSLAVTAWQLLIGFFVLAAGMLLADGLPHAIDLPPKIWAWIAYNGLIGLGLTYLIWFVVVDRLPAITASVGTLLVPVIGVAASAVLIGEIPTFGDSIGFALIFFAALCVLVPKHPHKRAVAISLPE
jgi:drug/metabolite transporter (DMT)-like permease